MDRLPVEILRQILDILYEIDPGPNAWLPERVRHLSWMLVCKHWQVLAEELLYRHVALEDPEHLLAFNRAVRKQPRRAAFIRSFELKNPYRLRKSSNTFLYIPFVHLRKLRLYDVHIKSSVPRFALTASTVSSVNLKNVTFASNELLRHTMGQFTHLEALEIEGDTWIRQDIISMLEVVGRSLKRFLTTKYERDMETILSLTPNVTSLVIEVNEQTAWGGTLVQAIPPQCEELHIRCTSTTFVIALLTALSSPDYLPRLQRIPQIVWWRARYQVLDFEQRAIMHRLAEDLPGLLIQQRGMDWQPEEAWGTIFERSMMDGTPMAD